MQQNLSLNANFGFLENWVGGKTVPVSSKDKVDIYSPYTGKSIGKVPFSDLDDVSKAVDVAKKAFPAWKSTHIKTRVQVMFKFKNLVEQKIDELSQIVAAENGKTLGEAKAGILKGLEIVEFACAIPNKISGLAQEVSDGVECRYSKEPLGVVASITPFNFPFMVPLWTIPLALTVGNTMVLKPSEQVPVSAMKIAELLKQSGLPAGVLNVVHGGQEVVEALCDNTKIAALSFVGSTKVAKIVYERAAKSHKRVVALGGAKNHLILLPDADSEYTPKQIVDSAIGCAGQRCMAASTMIAVGNCDKIIEQMVAYAKSVQLGSQMGAVINEKSVERINSYIAGAKDKGADLLVDGRNQKPEGNRDMTEGYWVGPTIIDNVAADAPAACEEIFGPVLSIVRVKTLEEAIEIENKNPYGNAASVFTQSGAAAKYVTDNASAGMVGVNIGVPVPREPFAFGGWNDSKFGVGDITGDAGLNFWTKDKKVTTKWLNPKNRNWMS